MALKNDQIPVKKSRALHKFHDDQGKYGIPEEGDGFVRRVPVS